MRERLRLQRFQPLVPNFAHALPLLSLYRLSRLPFWTIISPV